MRTIETSGPALDALLTLLRLVHTLVVPDGALVGVVAALAATAALAFVSVIVASVAALTSAVRQTLPAPDIRGAARAPRPDWARPDAPGRRRPRAPGLF